MAQEFKSSEASCAPVEISPDFGTLAHTMAILGVAAREGAALGVQTMAKDLGVEVQVHYKSGRDKVTGPEFFMAFSLEIHGAVKQMTPELAASAAAVHAQAVAAGIQPVVVCKKHRPGGEVLDADPTGPAGGVGAGFVGSVPTSTSMEV